MLNSKRMPNRSIFTSGLRLSDYTAYSVLIGCAMPQCGTTKQTALVYVRTEIIMCHLAISSEEN